MTSNVIAKMCARVLVMRGGRVVEEGATTQIFQSPKAAYTSDLVGAIPQLRAGAPRMPEIGKKTGT